MQIEVVENPRKRKRRRSRRRTTRRRRRNPALATLGNPRRRRRRRSGGYSVRHVVRRRRNPSFASMFDLKSMLWVGAGIFGSSRLIPSLIAKVWPGVPQSGAMAYAVRLGSGFALSFAIRTFMKDRKAADLVMVGTLASLFVDVLNQYVAPAIGLSGEYLTEADYNAMMSGYYDVPPGMTGYYDVAPAAGSGAYDSSGSYAAGRMAYNGY